MMWTKQWAKPLLWTFFLTLSLLFVAKILVAKDNKPLLVTTSVEADFDDIKENIELAISGQGLKISNTLHASDMLNRTGPDLGVKKNVFLKAETVEFCSAVLSHKMLAASPENIVFCPHAISIYVLTDRPKQVNLSYRRLPIDEVDDASAAAFKKVEQLLKMVIVEAIE